MDLSKVYSHPKPLFMHKPTKQYRSKLSKVNKPSKYTFKPINSKLGAKTHLRSQKLQQKRNEDEERVKSSTVSKTFNRKWLNSKEAWSLLTHMSWTCVPPQEVDISPCGSLFRWK